MRRRTLLLSITAAGIAGAAAFGWVTIRRGFSARDNPSALEAYLVRTARNPSIPASERDAKNPFAPTAKVLSEARTHFADHCATCHGNDGSGKTQIGQNLYPKAPDMCLPETQNLTDGELYYTIHNGIRLTGMPAWGTEEKDDDSWKLVLFIRYLPQLTPAEEREMEALNPKGPAEKEEEQEEEQFLNGEPSKQMPKQTLQPHPYKTMKRTVAVFALALALSAIAFAHGNEKHVMATVTRISDNSITVETTSQKTVTVTLSAATKFQKSGSPAALKDLKSTIRL
jgi:mono/diheme cytochrome c family protein